MFLLERKVNIILKQKFLKNAIKNDNNGHVMKWLLWITIQNIILSDEKL